MRLRIHNLSVEGRLIVLRHLERRQDASELMPLFASCATHHNTQRNPWRFVDQDRRNSFLLHSSFVARRRVAEAAIETNRTHRRSSRRSSTSLHRTAKP